jgi:hypothetical protein
VAVPETAPQLPLSGRSNSVGEARSSQGSRLSRVRSRREAHLPGPGLLEGSTQRGLLLRLRGLGGWQQPVRERKELLHLHLRAVGGRRLDRWGTACGLNCQLPLGHSGCLPAAVTTAAGPAWDETCALGRVRQGAVSGRALAQLQRSLQAAPHKRAAGPPIGSRRLLRGQDQALLRRCLCVCGRRGAAPS